MCSCQYQILTVLLFQHSNLLDCLQNYEHFDSRLRDGDPGTRRNPKKGFVAHVLIILVSTQILKV